MSIVVPPIRPTNRELIPHPGNVDSSTTKQTRGTTRRACDPCRISKSACTFTASGICTTCDRKRLTCTHSSRVIDSSLSRASAEPTDQGNNNSLISQGSSPASDAVEPPNAGFASLTPDELARVGPERVAEEELISRDGNVQRLIAVYFFRVYNVSWFVLLRVSSLFGTSP